MNDSRHNPMTSLGLLLAYFGAVAVACGSEPPQATCAAACRKFDRLCGAEEGLPKCESECTEELQEKQAPMQAGLDCIMTLSSCNLAQCGLKDDGKDFEVDKRGIAIASPPASPVINPPAPEGPASEVSECELLAPGCISTGSASSMMVSDLEQSSGTNANWSTNGGWYVALSSGSSADAPESSVPSSCGGADGTCRALCVSGTLSGDDYPWATIGLSANNGATWSAAGYTGISFWIKGSLGSATAAAFKVQTSGTLDAVNGGTCATDCFDGFSDALSVASDWQQAFIPFDALEQQGWGSPATWDPQIVVNLEWALSAAEPTLATEGYSLCIDNVAVY